MKYINVKIVKTIKKFIPIKENNNMGNKANKNKIILVLKRENLSINK